MIDFSNTKIRVAILILAFVLFALLSSWLNNCTAARLEARIDKNSDSIKAGWRRIDKLDGRLQVYEYNDSLRAVMIAERDSLIAQLDAARARAKRPGVPPPALTYEPAKDYLDSLGSDK